MGEVTKNFIEDKSNQDLVNSGVFDKKDKTLEKNTENAINEKVEKSFQEFLKNKKTTFDNLDDDGKQELFNGWLDKNVNGILEESKLKEIESVNPDIKSKLTALTFSIDLSAYQSEVIKQKENTKHTEIIKVNDSDITIATYKDSSGEKVKKEDIAKLFNTNFEKKYELLNLLKKGDIDSVKKFQRIIAGLKEDGSQDENAKGTKKILGIFGVDGKFGGETLEAFRKYIDNNKNPEGQSGNSGNTPAGQQVDAQGQQNSGQPSLNNNGNQHTEVGSGNNPQGTNNPENAGVTPGNANGSGVDSPTGGLNSPEILDREHEIKSLYEGESGTEIQIAKLNAGETIEIIPTVLAKNKDNPNGLDFPGGKFTLPESGWEGTVTIKLKNSKDEEKSYTITIKSKESQKQKENESKKTDLEEFVDGLQAAYNAELVTVIPQKIKELKAEYKKLMDPNNDEDPKLAEQRKKEIETAMHGILRAREMNKLEGYLSYIKKGTSIVSNKQNLSGLIPDNATIYIGGKYLTKSEFLQGENKNKKDYISKVKYKDLDVEIGNKFRDSEGSEDIRITRMVISDVDGFGKGDIAGKQEIQYDAVAYGKMENSGFDTDKDKKAIRKLIRGLDDALSIVGQDTVKENGERVILNKLKNGLLALYRAKQDVSDVFDFIAKTYANGFKGSKKDWKELIKGKYSDLNNEQAKYIANIGECFAAYKEDQDGNKLGAYFKRVMGLLENYFVRGVGKGNGKINSVAEMYDKERIGVVKGLIDPDKQRKAIKSLFKEGNNIGDVPYKSSEELNDLQKLIKNIDFEKFFEKTGVATEKGLTTPKLLNKKEEKFYEKYKKYVEYLRDNNLEDNKHPIVVEGDDYYNAVFDFLVGIGEARSDIVSAVNSLKLYDGEIDSDLVKESGFTDEAEMRLVCMLSDLNSDGRADFSDHGIKMGLEIKDIYKDALVDKKYGVIKNEPLYNLVEFAKVYAKKNNDIAVINKLKNIDKYDSKSLLEVFQSKPDLLKYLQKILSDSPANFVEDIFKHGAPDKKEANTNNEVLTEQEIIEETAAKVAIEQILNNEKFNETFEREYKNLVGQGAEDTKEARARLKPFVAAGVFQKITEQTSNTFDVDGKKRELTSTETTTDKKLLGSLAIGGVFETEKAGDFSLALGTVVSKDGHESVGVSMGRGDSRKVSEKTTVGAGVNAGGGYDFDNGFYLGASALVGASTKVNSKKLTGLKPVSAKYVNYGASAGVGYNLKDKTVGVSVGAHLGFSQDKMEGINSGYDNIKNQLSGEKGLLSQVLSNIDFAEPEDEIKSKIRSSLQSKFYPNADKGKGMPKKDADNLDKATSNIYRALSYYMTSFNVQDIENPEQKKQVINGIANNIAELYATQWRNEAVNDIKGKLYLESLSVGIIWVIGSVCPIPTGGMTRARYRGIYSHETAASQEAYSRELLTGANAKFQGDELNFYNDDESFNENGVAYINEKLQIANGNVKVPEIKLNSTMDVPTPIDGSPAEVEKGSYLTLPKDLYKYVNININSKLKNYISTDKDGNINVPSNTKVTLLTSHETNTAKFNLIIGDTKASADDILIRPDSKMSGNAEVYEGEISEYELNVDAANEAIEEIRKQEGGNDFPIEKCAGITTSFGSEKYVQFNVKKGTTITDMGGENSRSRILKDGTILVPQTGTMVIYKIQEGKFNLYYMSDPKNDLDIKYEIEGKPGENKPEIIVTPNSINTYEFSDDYYGDNFKTQLNEIISILNKADIRKAYASHKNDYKDLMTESCENGDYTEAFETLKNIINITSSSNYQDIQQIKDFVNDENLTDNQKILIVDQCKMYFSYVSDLTDGKGNDYNTLKWLIKEENRGNVYENLYGYDNSTKFPLKGKKYRDTIVENLKEKDLKWKDNTNFSNLIGMTAFYKKNLKEKNGRGYSMTTLGNTTPLGGYMEPIADTDLDSTKDWFRKNLEKTNPHKEIIKNTINNRITASGITDNDELKKLEVNDDVLEKLLKGEEFEINIEKSVDKGKKNDKIILKLKTEYDFYLLQECANESIGVQLQGLEIIQGSTQTTVEQIPGEKNKYLVKKKKILVRTGGSGFYTNSHEGMNQQDLSRKGHFSILAAGGKIESKDGTNDGTTEVVDDKPDVPVKPPRPIDGGTTEVVDDKP